MKVTFPSAFLKIPIILKKNCMFKKFKVILFKKNFYSNFLWHVVACMRQINIHLSNFFKIYRKRPKIHVDRYTESSIHPL